MDTTAVNSTYLHPFFNFPNAIMQQSLNMISIANNPSNFQHFFIANKHIVKKFTTIFFGAEKIVLRREVEEIKLVAIYCVIEGIKKAKKQIQQRGSF